MARGCIVKRGDTYCIKYRVDGEQKWKTVGPNKKEAERALVECMRKIHRGEYVELKETTFAEFAEQWLKDYAEAHVKPSTYRFYADIVNPHLKPFFGSLKLTAITAQMIDKYVSGKVGEAKLSRTTIGYHQRVLKTMLKKAVDWGYLFANPADKSKRLKVTDTREMDFFSHEEAKLFLTKVEPAYYPLFATAVFTGMRRGELLALKWGDIDFNSGHIHVKRSLYKREFTDPKSRCAKRKIEVGPDLLSTLKQHQKLVLLQDDEGALVFANEEGKPLDPNNLVKRHFLPALTRARLRRIRFHDLRHTYASLMIANSANFKWLQHQMGHSTMKMTVDRYGHLIPDAHTGAAKKLEESVFGPLGSKVVAEASQKTDRHKHPSKKSPFQAKKVVGDARIELATSCL